MVLLSELHLGFRPPGTHQGPAEIREEDVAGVFLRALREVVRLTPHLVLVTGDVFHHPSPSPAATAVLLGGLRRFRSALPDTPVLLLAGARDTPLDSGDPGPLAILEGFPGVEVALRTPRAVHMGEAGIHVLLVPHDAVASPPHPPLRPHAEARWNLLALHGRPGGRRGHLPVRAEEWDLVVLGGDHHRSEPASGVLFPGSLERVSGDPWREAGKERGFLSVELGVGRPVFHPLPGRPVVELAPIRRGVQSMPRVNARLRAAVDAVPGGVDGKLLRLRVHGVGPEERADLDGAFLGVLRRRAAVLQVQLRVGDGPAPSLQLHPGGRGLRAVVGGTRRERTLLLRSWRRDGPDGLPAPPEPGGTEEQAGASLLWGGPEARWTPEGLLSAAASILVRLRGGRERTAVAPVSAPTAPAPGKVAELRLELTGAVEEVRRLRGEAVEVDGEVEARTVEWLRERQDAETHLQAHRDRARELRGVLRRTEEGGAGGPCPVCGRPLEEHLTPVVAAFREEWDLLVQDGRWWRRRREQLEGKPEALREMELRGFRLHGELERAAERAERLRARLEGVDGEATHGSPPAPGGVPGALRELGARGSDLLNRLSAGDVAGILLPDGEDGLRLVRDGELFPPDDPGEEAGVLLALHLALVELALEGGTQPELLRLPELMDRLPRGWQAPALELLSYLARHLPGVLVSGDGTAVALAPGLFQGVVELRRGERGGGDAPPLRLVQAAPARIHLVD